MPKLIPDYGPRLDSMVESLAERRVYSALKRQLPADFVVLHSVSWLSRTTEGQALDGECDFLVVHPELGLLAIEVKGGGICFDPHNRVWSSRDRNGIQHQIKDPFQQARNAKHQILALLRRTKDWMRTVGGKVCCGHAVWFPDLTVIDGLVGPDRPGSIILGSGDLDNALPAIERILQFWRDGSPAMLGRAGVQTVEGLFARRLSVMPTGFSRIQEEEQRRIELTDAQFRILRLLGSRRRVGIAGGAGTGKTLLAIEKAHELARAGHSTLLLAYNSALGDHLAASVDHQLPITAGHFHSFCAELFKRHGEQYLARAKQDFPDNDRWDVHFPAALCYLLEDHPIKFDAIVIDEAQDFADEFWLPLEFMMSDSKLSPLYLFYDNNQRIYRRQGSFPIAPEEEFVLTENCRNTGSIHAVVSRFYSGSQLMPPPIEGVEVTWHGSPTIERQARWICEQIRRLTVEEKIPAIEIVVLVVDRLGFKDFSSSLAGTPLPQIARLSENPSRQNGRVRILTAAKFKGLEAAVVFVWGIDTVNADAKRAELYVALSRPRSELYVVGTDASVAEIKCYSATETTSP